MINELLDDIWIDKHLERVMSRHPGAESVIWIDSKGMNFNNLAYNLRFNVLFLKKVNNLPQKVDLEEVCQFLEPYLRDIEHWVLFHLKPQNISLEDWRKESRMNQIKKTCPNYSGDMRDLFDAYYKYNTFHF